ncbi:MAG TPA: glycoside-pentoside-hexuronide (GPH):cation symporter [Marinagarivorans sp.]
MKKLSLTEKFGYSLGDVASNIVFQVVMNYMIYFYTDVFGITAAAAGTLMLAVRLFDGVTDPLMGAVADRTKTRWGRYRPWLLWVSIPFAVLAVLTFSTPDFSDDGKLIYAYISYALLMIVYTAFNIPYSALGGVITSDQQDRASVQAWRMGAAMIGGTIVTASLLPLVGMLGGENQQLGFSLAMAVMGVFGILCLVGCFALTRERVQEPESAEKAGVFADVKVMLANSQWWIIAGVTLLGLIGVVMRGSGTAYYVEYYLGREDMISLFLTAPMIAGLLGAISAGIAVKKMCKVTVMKIGAMGIFLFHLLLFFVPQDGLYVALVLTCLANYFHMVFFPMVFAAVADTVEYSRYKTGKGGMGMSYSGHLLALKFGMAFGGAATGWIIHAHGYVAGQAQTELALDGIIRVFAGGSVCASAFMIIAMFFYKLKKPMMENISQANAAKAESAM